MAGLASLNSRLERVRRKFLGDRSGVSAVEFALILPVMLLLFFGGIEVSEALTVKRKVTHVTSTLSDLITQSKKVTASDMDDILDAASSIIMPFAGAQLRIKLTGVAIDEDGEATVAWSDALNDTPLPKNSSITLPPSIVQPNTFIVTGEVHYDYTPTIGYVLTGSFDLSDQFYLRPRLGSDIEYEE
jgi:Flp pilus assembly protein TadG